MKHSQITPVRRSAVLEAAEAAARAIPPAFPLDATVAVNPFLGQTGEDMATAAARLGRVAGVRITRTGADYAAAIRYGRISEEDLHEALAAAMSPLLPADTTLLRSA
ncbi:MAG: putative inorganic carbon transporter subunit DabA, partial [Erythrobacteraceae bacterium]